MTAMQAKKHTEKWNGLTYALVFKTYNLTLCHQIYHNIAYKFGPELYLWSQNLSKDRISLL